MAAGRVFCGGPANASDFPTLLIPNQTTPSASQPLDSLFLSSSSSPFLGSRSMMSFEDVKGGNGSFFRPYDPDETGDEDMDEYFHQPEKKRRLSVDQVHFLEKSFDQENKLEPERKTRLAMELGLQPRQVAIWFQNRRARCKSKQLERDYDSLQASYNDLKANYDNLLREKDKLKTEVANLTEKVLGREKGETNVEQAETNGLLEPLEKPLIEYSAWEGERSEEVSIGGCNQEDISSDIRVLETGDSSYVFEPDHSDLSQDEEDNLSKTLLPLCIFPKLEDVDYSDDLPHSSCNFGFPEEDQAIWSWCY